MTNQSSEEPLHRRPTVPKIMGRNSFGYRKIGFGQCGIIFDYPEENSVFKLARPHFSSALLNDFSVHQRVYRTFREQRHRLACHVPIPHSHITEGDNKWWSANESSFPQESIADVQLPASVLISQRIPSAPAIVRNALIDLYCPPSLIDSAKASMINQDCVVRIYLGWRRPADAPLPPNFTLRNYNLCLDQMLALGLPVERYAEVIATSLATVHWGVMCDGYDVEFVLGGSIGAASQQHKLTDVPADTIECVLGQDLKLEEATPGRKQQSDVAIWLLDFNLCSVWNEADLFCHIDEILDQMVLALFENDPYFPLPLMEDDMDKRLWDVFSESYLSGAQAVLVSHQNYDKMKSWPRRFIEKCIARERQSLELGLGHGHRDLKG